MCFSEFAISIYAILQALHVPEWLTCIVGNVIYFELDKIGESYYLFEGLYPNLQDGCLTKADPMKPRK